MSKKMSGASSLVQSLESAGVDVMFGIPGGAILPAYDPIFDSSIRHILVRHEQGAGHAATGYAQVTGRVGVCIATSGPGATNLVTPLADAAMDSVPLVAITGQGIINGNGMYWRPLKKEKLSDAEWKRHLQEFGGALTEDKKTWYPSKAAAEASKAKDIGKLVNGKKIEDFEGIKDFLRPNMLRISGCNKVLIEGVTFENSPAWTTHFLMSKDITIKGMRVKNPWWGTNTDAIDLESCSNALLEDCVLILVMME